MAGRSYQFGFREVELFKEDSLGTGSYGGVCRAKCDGLPCAAKIMHPTLFDLRDPGTPSYLRKFEEEICLLSSARHPNVVQYLGTYRDPETRLPVLLMELCDESLCRFLERSPGPVAYHTQLNIAHDIALALVYLHQNSLTHRDLTGNNVLMIAGVRAKVTDFGMSRLANVNPQPRKTLTLCPGNVNYMSPEALEEPPSYTDKLDVFSFGVLLVQIMTRRFPDPGPRFKFISMPGYPEARVLSPETERRASHLRLIADTHPLKAIAIYCLKGKERERPTAQQLNRTLCAMKEAPDYRESVQQTQTRVEGEGEVEQLREQVRDLQHQVSTHQEDIQQKERVVSEKEREIEQLQHQSSMQTEQLQSEQDEVVAQNRQLRQQLQTKARETEQVQRTLEERERELVEKSRAVQSSEQLVAQFQQNLEEKERTISDLQQAMSARDSGDHRRPRNPPASQKTATASAVVKDISRLRWEEGKKAPETMFRGSAVADGNTVYINPHGSLKMYSCKISSQDQQWSTLPDTEYYNANLVVIDGTLTSVGGYSRDWTYANSLLSLTGGGGERRRWCEIFPAMPTPRSSTISLTTEPTLIVTGGYDGGKNLSVVEVMDISTRQWSTASNLPHPFGVASGTICGDNLYLAGGYVGVGKPSKSVLTCSMTDLLSPLSLGARLQSLSLANKTSVWRQARDLPVIRSTLITLGGHLLAIGGRNDSRPDTADVYCYDNHNDSWQVVSQMKSARHACLAAALSDDHLLVVGGLSNSTVEIASL